MGHLKSAQSSVDLERGFFSLYIYWCGWLTSELAIGGNNSTVRLPELLLVKITISTVWLLMYAVQLSTLLATHDLYTDLAIFRAQPIPLHHFNLGERIGLLLLVLGVLRPRDI